MNLVMFGQHICSTYRLIVAHEFAFELTHELCLSTTHKNDGCFSLILHPICLGCPLSISSLSCELHKLRFGWQLFLFTGTEKSISCYVEKGRKSSFALTSPILHPLCSTNQEHTKKSPTKLQLLCVTFPGGCEQNLEIHMILLGREKQTGFIYLQLNSVKNNLAQKARLKVRHEYK